MSVLPAFIVSQSIRNRHRSHSYYDDYDYAYYDDDDDYKYYSKPTTEVEKTEEESVVEPEDDEAILWRHLTIISFIGLVVFLIAHFCGM